MESGQFGFEKHGTVSDVEIASLKDSLPVLPEGTDVPPDLVQSSLDALGKLPPSLDTLGRELLLEKLKRSE